MGMVTNNAQSRSYATVESVSSLSVESKRHPNIVKASNQLRYRILVQITPPSSPRRPVGETGRTVRLTTDLEAQKGGHLIGSFHGYLSDLPSKISARNENCALLAPSSAFCPLIKSDYTTRNHLIRRQVPTSSPGIGDISGPVEPSKKCAPTTKKRTIGDMFAKMKNVTPRPQKSKIVTEEGDRGTAKGSKMQYGDHEYCSTKYPLVRAFQKQTSKTRNPKAAPQPIAKVEEPLPEVSVATAPKRQWIDTSSSDEEQKSSHPPTTSNTLSKRLRPSDEADPSHLRADVTDLDHVVPAQPKVLPKLGITREGERTSRRHSRSATKKMPSQAQSKTVLSFVKKTSK